LVEIKSRYYIIPFDLPFRKEASPSAIRKYSEAGDKKAQYLLGVTLIKETIVERDQKEAFK